MTRPLARLMIRVIRMEDRILMGGRCLLWRPRLSSLRDRAAARLAPLGLPSVSQEEIERGAIACLIGVVVIAIMIGL